MTVKITTIWVPQGAEYNAVCQGLQSCTGHLPQVRALPVGPQPVMSVLQQWLNRAVGSEPHQVMIMGLCGSLTPQLDVGTTVIYRGCLDGQEPGNVPALVCDAHLHQFVVERLARSVIPVTAVTCDRIICQAQDKQTLAQSHQAQVVDMEGFAALSVLTAQAIPVTMVRVVSDDVHHDLPDISEAIGPDGHIRAIPMATKMLGQPVAAARLIRGSLQGLARLKQVTRQLFMAEIPRD